MKRREQELRTKKSRMPNGCRMREPMIGPQNIRLEERW